MDSRRLRRAQIGEPESVQGKAGKLTSTRRLTLGLALSATLVVCGAARAELFVEYLHVEAGSGASGGGHAALRFADTTYHYVYAEPGIIESAAEANDSFDYAYRGLGNRSIHSSRIVVAADVYDALAESFERRHITQQKQVEVLDAAVRDQALIAYLRKKRCGRDDDRAIDLEIDSQIDSMFRLRGAGYFSAPSRAAAEKPGMLPVDGLATVLRNAPIAELRAEIERQHGEGYLERRKRALVDEIARLAFVPATANGLAFGTIPPKKEGFSEGYETLALAGEALDVLLSERIPVAAAYRRIDEPARSLSESELATLAARAAELRSSLSRLVATRREDWGYPMLVGMVRLVALDASLRSGQLVVPDSLDEAAAWVPVETLLADPPVVDALLRERRHALDDARAELFAAPATDEAAWSRFEVATSALLDLAGAVRRREGVVRAYSDTLLPSRGAEPDETSALPAADCAELGRWATLATAATASIRDRLREIYRYDVVSRNCVTELFRTIEAASRPISLDAEATADAGLGFVPFVSAAAVNRKYPIDERVTLPSYRKYWLSRLRETDGSLRVALRESNTLTATLRHPDELDDVFLFYTEDTVALRPLYGAINAGVGAGATVMGLVTLPFDRGQRLTTGVRSFVFSLPELAFVNLRKGRNGVLPWTWTVESEGPF